MDPRVKTPRADLIKQFTMAQQIGGSQAKVRQALREANNLRERLGALQGKLTGQQNLVELAEALGRKITAIAGPPLPRTPSGFGEDASDIGESNLRSLAAAWSEIDQAVESADAAPTADAVTAFSRDQQLMQKLSALWQEVKSKDLPRLNESLKKAGLDALPVESEVGKPEASPN
jgi:hypothetical protein